MHRPRNHRHTHQRCHTNFEPQPTRKFEGQPVEHNLQSNAQPQGHYAVTQQRIGTKNRNPEKVKIEAQQGNQHDAIAQKHQQPRTRFCDLPPMKQNDQAKHSECKSR